MKRDLELTTEFTGDSEWELTFTANQVRIEEKHTETCWVEITLEDLDAIVAEVERWRKLKAQAEAA